MPPEIEFTYTEIIRDTLLRELYADQESYWCAQLQPLVTQNTAYHQRALSELYGIHYLGKDWYPVPGLNRIYTEPWELIYYLPLHPDLAPEIEPKLLFIINELSQLKLEEYECSRFLAGLVLFPAPLHVFAQVLGKQLFQKCEEDLAQHVMNNQEYAWDANTQAALTTYVAHHEYILKAMQQRLLINMITRDQIRQ
jgi:hypothetical protein